MKNLTVNLKDRSYDIIIKRGLLKEIKSFIKTDGKIFVISNETVFNLYGKYFEDFEILLMKDGEKYKNFDTYKYLIEKLLSLNIERGDLIIALGGGVTGDVAGFVASTCLRGVDLIQIPTTLLAQVDSSVGGKTGIDTQFGKNLIGTFYQPKMVLIDPDVLSTLDLRQFKTGMCEVVKYAFIEKNSCEDVDELFFDYLNSCDIKEDIEDIIYRCCKIKADIVSSDEKEKGLRAVLNFGHTIAHGIEKVTNYEILTHGEAVSYGMAVVFKIALQMGFIEKDYYDMAINLLKKFDIYYDFSFKERKNEIIKLLYSDKKTKGGKLNFVMPKSLALVQTNQNIDELSIKENLL